MDSDPLPMFPGETSVSTAIACTVSPINTATTKYLPVFSILHPFTETLLFSLHLFLSRKRLQGILRGCTAFLLSKITKRRNAPLFLKRGAIHA
jgi:hypothetical protein